MNRVGQLFSKESFQNDKLKGLRSVAAWSEEELLQLEASHPEGMSAQQIIACFVERGEKLTEASFRKYVQLGLLPRSVRVGRQGQGRGSLGLYPAVTVRQIDRIRRLMSQGYSIEDLQKSCLFIRGDIELLSASLQRVFGSLSEAIHGDASAIRAAGVREDRLAKAIEEVRSMGVQLLEKLQGIEDHMAKRVRMMRSTV